jgi:pyridoxamine 5'-phosphate oxidase
VSTERRREPTASRPGAGPGTAARIESLGLLRRACWHELERATLEREHGWRALALATLDGSRPDARMVILREVDAQAQCLRFYTDARSRKVAQIGTQPRGTLLAWCPRLSWQLRLQVRLRIDTEEPTVLPRWARLRMMPSSQDYMSPLAPGSPLPAGPGPGGEGPQAHFAVVHAEVEAMDWLELHTDSHRRACFDAQGERWVQP